MSEDINGFIKLENNNVKPWEKRDSGFVASDIEGILKITIADKIYINTENLKPKIQNSIRRLAAFSNPNFYKNQAIGLSNRGISRIIFCGQDIDGFICIPRGCEEQLISKLVDYKINYNIEDCRQKGISISVNFKGELYQEQQIAVDKMLQYNTGVLSAATAFGKTVVGANLVAQHKVNTLILVHNTEIMKNWVEDFSKFLDIKEDLPTYTTPTGRIKNRKSIIRRLYGGHNSVTGIIDVVMISSLGKLGEINQLVKDYGLVIMDECHHGASITSEIVLNEVKAKYVYGFTAAPKRDDGMEQKIFMQFGPIRYRYTAKEKALSQGFEHFIYPRFTRLIQISNESKSINEIYKLVRESDIRNSQIVADVKSCVDCGRTPLVLTKFKDHVANLFENLKCIADNVFLLEGGKSSKEKDSIRSH